MLATRVICKGLMNIGLIKGMIIYTVINRKGSFDELMKHHVTAVFFPHGLGHMLGIDGNKS